jgi:saccharopine dehydrogenase (NAD+, L-lysine forming)
VGNNSWATAPTTTIIIGLKELPTEDSPLSHTHIQFAHCYKGQAGWSSVLSRFHRGNGTLYDIEFLTDVQGRRVAAFGFYAGFTGAAAGALALASIKKGESLGPLEPFVNEEALITAVKKSLGGSGKGIKALIIGALGRCGRGAVDLFRKIGLAEYVLNLAFPFDVLVTIFVSREDILKWDLDETAHGGPFQEILDVDVFVNCIYLNSTIPPFITHDQIAAAGSTRRLAVVVDVSCDTTNPFNPIPIYTINTTFPKPTVSVDVG